MSLIKIQIEKLLYELLSTQGTDFEVNHTTRKLLTLLTDHTMLSFIIGLLVGVVLEFVFG